jgi:hypothetical protein
VVIISYDIHWCSQWEPARVSHISWERPNLGYFILGHLFPSCRMSMKICNQHLQKKPFKSSGHQNMWQKVTQAGTRVPRVPIFKQWTDHVYPQTRFLNLKCITHRNLRYSNFNHLKECTNHLVPLDYTHQSRPMLGGYHKYTWHHLSIIWVSFTNLSRVSSCVISGLKIKLSILTESIFKAEQKISENEVKSDPLPGSRSQGLAAIKN